MVRYLRWLYKFVCVALPLFYKLTTHMHSSMCLRACARALTLMHTLNAHIHSDSLSHSHAHTKEYACIHSHDIKLDRKITS